MSARTSLFTTDLYANGTPAVLHSCYNPSLDGLSIFIHPPRRKVLQRFSDARRRAEERRRPARSDAGGRTSPPGQGRRNQGKEAQKQYLDGGKDSSAPPAVL